MPASETFVIHHKTDPVAQIELKSTRHAGDVADHVEAHRLTDEDVFAVKIRVQRNAVRNRRIAAGMGAFDVDALAVETKKPVFKTEIAESASRATELKTCYGGIVKSRRYGIQGPRV